MTMLRLKRGDLGKTVYPTYGFIYQSNQFATRSAAETAVRTVAQTAMSQLAAAVPAPGSNPGQMLSQATGSTDRIAALIQAVTGAAPSEH